MSISATEQYRRQAGKTAAAYWLLTILTAFFGAIYECFSHGVYSYFMIYAFAFPLIAGVLPFQLLHIKPIKSYPRQLFRQLYHCGIATLTVGSLVQGVLDIYGTTNGLVAYYWWIGTGLIAISVLSFYLNPSIHISQK